MRSSSGQKQIIFTKYFVRTGNPRYLGEKQNTKLFTKLTTHGRGKLHSIETGQKFSIHHFKMYSGIFSLFRIFLKFQNFAILSPDQPLYDLTWHIRFSEPKLNIFVDKISCYHTSKKGSLSIKTKWIACARSKRDV